MIKLMKWFWNENKLCKISQLFYRNIFGCLALTTIHTQPPFANNHLGQNILLFHIETHNLLWHVRKIGNGTSRDWQWRDYLMSKICNSAKLQRDSNIQYVRMIVRKKCAKCAKGLCVINHLKTFKELVSQRKTPLGGREAFLRVARCAVLAFLPGLKQANHIDPHWNSGTKRRQNKCSVLKLFHRTESWNFALWW